MSELTALGYKHGTDKVNNWHTFNGKCYLDVYDTYFQKFKNKNLRMMEIGVCDARSLRIWPEYFTNAEKIYGLDIDPRCAEFNVAGAEVIIGSQTDTELLNSLGNFDLVIDDGSHVLEHILISLDTLLPKINSGGLYVIEDLYCSYMDLNTHWEGWPGMIYNKDTNYNNDRSKFNEYIMNTVKKFDNYEGDVEFVHFWHQVCIIGKV